MSKTVSSKSIPVANKVKSISPLPSESGAIANHSRTIEDKVVHVSNPLPGHPRKVQMSKVRSTKSIPIANKIKAESPDQFNEPGTINHTRRNENPDKIEKVSIRARSGSIRRTDINSEIKERTTMAFKNKPLIPAEDLHPLIQQFGHLGISGTHDSPAAAELLKDIHDQSMFRLTRLFDTIKKVKEDKGLNELRPEIAAQKRIERLRTSRLEMLGDIKATLDKALADAAGCTAAIYRVTAHEEPSSDVKALRQDIKFSNIYRYLESIEPPKRADVIRDNPDFMKALQACPYKIISDKTLMELRREFAINQDPDLAQREKNYQALYSLIRRRAAEANAASIKLIIESGLSEDDPADILAHYDAFPPQDDREAQIMIDRVQKFHKERDQAERRAKWEEEHPGVNLGGSQKPIPKDTSSARKEAGKIEKAKKTKVEQEHEAALRAKIHKEIDADGDDDGDEE